MQNSMGIFTFLGYGRKYLFWAYLVQKFKFVCSGKNLLPAIIREVSETSSRLRVEWRTAGGV